MKQDFAKFDYNSVKCYVCGKSDFTPLYDLKDKYKEGRISFVKCTHDGLILQNPCPTPKSLERFFNSSSFSSKRDTSGAQELTGYFDYLSGEKFRKKMSKERLDDLNCLWNNKKNLKILKIAPGTGIFLKLAKDYGHEVTGLDVSEFFVNYARENHGINMIHSLFEEHEFGNEKFDVILLFGAIFNVTNPRIVLEKIYSLLNKGGQLHINYISSDNWFHKMQKSNFWLIRPPVISFFNQQNFNILLKDIGFQITVDKQEIQYTHLAKLAYFSKLKWLIKIVELFKLHQRIIKIKIPGARYVVASN